MTTKTISRRDARIAAMRIIFAAISGNCSANEQMHNISLMKGKQKEYDTLTEEIVRVYDLQRDDIEKKILNCYDRHCSLITVVEHAIIACAMSEMLCFPNTPYQIIINEAVEISKLYGTDKGYQLVNGILEKIR